MAVKFNIEDDTVTISTAEYERLLEESNWLGCLEAAGVDNWGGYSFAQDLRDEANAENDK